MSSGGPEFAFLTIDELRAVVKCDLTDDELSDVLDREAAWLARRIGPLDGERTQEFFVERGADRPILLPRPTGAVEVTDGGEALDTSQVRLLSGGAAIERIDAPWTGPGVVVTYTPDDDAEVARVLCELVRFTVTESAYEQERIGEYSYVRGSGAATRALREGLANELKPHRGAGTVRVRSAMLPDRVGAIT